MVLLSSLMLNKGKSFGVSLKALLFPLVLLFGASSLYLFVTTGLYARLLLISSFLFVPFFVHADLEIPKKDFFIGMGLVLIGSLYLSFYQMVLDLGDGGTLQSLEQNIDYRALMTPTHAHYESDYVIPYLTINGYANGAQTINEKLVNTYNVTDRTPFLSFAVMPILLITDWNMFMFEQGAGFFSSLYLLPLFLVTSAALGKKTALPITLFAAIAHFYLLTSIYAEAKMLAIYFILTALLFVFKPLTYKHVFLASFGLVLAYFTHQFSLMYFFTFGAILALRLVTAKYKFSELIKYGMLLVIPLFIASTLWTSFSKSLGHQNAIVKNVMFENDWREASVNLSKNEAPSSFEIISRKEYWVNKKLNLLNFFVLNPNKGEDQGNILDYHRTTLIGQTTKSFLIISLVAVILFFAKKRRLDDDRAKMMYIALIVFLPILLAVLYAGPYIRVGLWVYAVLSPVFLVTLLTFFLQKENMLFYIAFILAYIETIVITFTDPRLDVANRLQTFLYAVPGGFNYFLGFVVPIVFLSVILCRFSLQSDPQVTEQ